MTVTESIAVIESGDLIHSTLATIMGRHQTTVRHLEPQQVLEPTVTDLEPMPVCAVLVADPESAALMSTLIGAVRNAWTEIPLIVLVEHDGMADRSAWMAAGANDVLSAPLAYTYLLNRHADFSDAVVHREPHCMTLKQGREVAFRFLRPEDAEIEQAFVRDLSDRSRYFRFFAPLKELPPGLLDAFTHTIFPHTFAVIATCWKNGKETQVGVARYAKVEGQDATAEFAVAVADDWQGVGLARALMHIVIMAASMAGFRCLEGSILRENTPMRRLAERLGFEAVSVFDEEPGAVRVRKSLVASVAA